MNRPTSSVYKEFLQREDGILRAPYRPELEFYAVIQSGDVEKTKKMCSESLLDKQGLGILSPDPLKNIKYHFIITTALIARYCIEGGMELSASYALSDYYIREADRCTNPAQVAELHLPMCLDYAKRMKKLRKNNIYSAPVVKCIDYIYENLHTRITVNALAEHVGLNLSYLSRLFKKETGTTISGYISDKKIETARNMLLYSEYSPAEIAAILAYPSQSYFSCIFKRKSGMSPLQYRRKNFRAMPFSKEEH